MYILYFIIILAIRGQVVVTLIAFLEHLPKWPRLQWTLKWYYCFCGKNMERALCGIITTFFGNLWRDTWHCKIKYSFWLKPYTGFLDIIEGLEISPQYKVGKSHFAPRAWMCKEKRLVIEIYMRFHLEFIHLLYLSYLSPVGQMCLTSIFYKLAFLGWGVTVSGSLERLETEFSETNQNSLYSPTEAGY